MNFSGFEFSSIVAFFLLILQLSTAAVLPADYAYGVADEMSALPDSGSLFAEQRPSKRAQTFVRFGKRAQTFVRFGKRGQTFVRFGRSAPFEQ
ncbi:GQTFVRF-amide [Caenorhabditis elegans]|uniref:FMRFamide-like neuropeptides 16 n=1 Tax=Caenorhabditis elegans TaxID=6239 RepID=FLP16_CAEEL|nr:GQTFVRF-amide [Caenorhabditis elegans]Q7YX32.1 RecName: Full=FMRFamide-like neuropeptides 16; Contains: RecName: Full=AQTFVRF-amide 1; Contains: RecName: Full=AQTFVRF-amide 2; Contains: RecName: Full=GQTFVRF-amide; Flags: Precursor [Caenorhabditis elegans]CAE17795.1 GQTFVRF-amide [Caenorhabditis elegans]|eukprot:NP_001022091.1 GQTFVRF-amide [Caenorhabditis elegans]